MARHTGWCDKCEEPLFDGWQHTCDMERLRDLHNARQRAAAQQAFDILRARQQRTKVIDAEFEVINDDA